MFDNLSNSSSEPKKDINPDVVGGNNLNQNSKSKNSVPQPINIPTPQSASSVGSAEPEDIFSDVDAVEEPDYSNQVPNINLPNQINQKGGDGDLMAGLASVQKSGGGSKKIIIIVVIIIIAIVSALVVYYLFLQPKNIDTNMSENNTPEDVLPQSGDTDTTTSPETVKTSENSLIVDTDTSTTPDADTLPTLPVVEVDIDTDGDGLSDVEESVLKTNPLKTDSDNDGLIDKQEVSIHQTNPLLSDSDNDGLTDYDEVIKHKTDPNRLDTDNDGLTDFQEIMTYGTNPILSDTDKDTYSDGDEVRNGYNPTGEGKLDQIDLP